jgi:AraC family transcriptional regulator
MLTDTQYLQEYVDCIEDVKRYIRNHIHEPLDRETLASVAGFSIPHFHRVFSAHVGESAISYVRRMRMLRAGQKLRMGAVDITEVALAAGFDSHAAFSKAFKQHFGLSPSEFRQLNCFAATELLRKG